MVQLQDLWHDGAHAVGAAQVVPKQATAGMCYPPPECDQRASDPAMFYGTPYINFFHIMMDEWAPVFPTLDQLGLFDNYRISDQVQSLTCYKR